MNNTEQILNQFLNELAQTYKEILIANHKQASGNLVNSIRPNEVQLVGNTYECSISAAEYAKYVEDGRKPGKFPPPPAIQGWVKVKFPEKNDRMQKQLSFLIGRKIAKYGIKPGNYLEEAMRRVFPKYNELLNDALERDLQLK